MVSGLINENPIIYPKKERRLRTDTSITDELTPEPIDQLEIFDHIRDIKDPEHPNTLEDLRVVTEDSVEVDDENSYVRVTFTPTVEHCSMATVIGLCVRVKLLRSLPSRYKIDIRVAPGSHATEDALNKHDTKEKGFWEYDYESFVEVSKRVMQGRSRVQQQEAVREVLLSMLPPGAPEQFRKLFPPTKWAAEFNAALTVPFFHWLVGPSQVIEVEVNGVKQRSGVRIKKCRYLENSGCVGMCVNMCKIPTQDFFTNEFGLPLTMNPNYEDMSCEMIYGQAPPAFEEDVATKQPCLADICSMSNPSSPICPKLEA